MPIEIREMIIRADVRDPGTASTPTSTRSPALPDKKEIVEEAVDRVLEILKRQKER